MKYLSIIGDDTALLGLDDGTYYLINLKNAALNCKFSTPDNGILHTSVIARISNSIFYIEKAENDEANFIEYDIPSKKILKRTPITFALHPTYLQSSNNKILIKGRDLYIYDVVEESFTRIDNITKYYGTVFLNDTIIFNAEEGVYKYNIETEMCEEIYNLKGMDVVDIFLEKDMLFLVLANDIRHTFANDKPFTCVLLDVSEN